MKGHSIAGMSTTRDRVEDDFYATPENSIEALLEVEKFEGSIWECACGDGAISKVLKKHNYRVISSDLIDRGYGDKVGINFLSSQTNKEIGYDIYDNIVTNPPFNLFQEFAEQSLREANKKVALFGKLQALEGQKRATFLQNSPLRTVYVFKARQNPLRNGSPVDENGKPWASTMAFAWFVWEIGYTGKPTIEWI